MNDINQLDPKVIEKVIEVMSHIPKDMTDFIDARDLYNDAKTDFENELINDQVDVLIFRDYSEEQLKEIIDNGNEW